MDIEEPDPADYYDDVIVPAVESVYRDLVRNSPNLDVPLEYMLAAMISVYTSIRGDVVGIGMLETARNLAYGVPVAEQTGELAIADEAVCDVVNGGTCAKPPESA